jgi:phosphate transport system substrate-binding protein
MKNTRYILFLSMITLLISCGRKPVVERNDTSTSGEAKLACDDCFSPIIREEVSVFQALNQEATILPVYTNEMDAFNLLFKDSVRLIIAARDLSPSEKKALQDKKLLPRSCKIAVDGIALIINKQNRDSLITISQLKDILAGKIQKWSDLYPGSNRGIIKVVFDNPNSSTVRYIQDSVYQGRITARNISARENNKAVIDYVSKTPNAIGIVGVSWISNPKDTTKLSFIPSIRVMAVSPYDEARDDNSYLPFPAYLALGKYPLARDIYAITSDVPGCLPSGFMNFIGGDRGQRIIMKAGMLPATRPMRLVRVVDSE